MQHATYRSRFVFLSGLIALSLILSLYGQAAVARDNAALTKLQLQAVVDEAYALYKDLDEGVRGFVLRC